MEVVQLLSNSEKKKNTKNAKNKISNEILNKWNTLLQEEFNLIDRKKHIGSYNSVYATGIGEIVVAFNSLNMPFDYNDRIQLTLKEGGIQKTVGKYNGILDEKTLTLLPDSGINLDDFRIPGILSIDTNQEKSNLKRFSRALDEVKCCNTVNPNIPSILEDASIVTMNKITPISKFFQNVFDDNDSPNSLAVKKALSTKDIFILQGPPGTGKTTVITEIICQILKSDPDAKILLTSQSNVAVDNAAFKVAQILPDKYVVRIGRTEKIAKTSEKLLYSNQLDEWVKKIKLLSVDNVSIFLQKKYADISKDNVNKFFESFTFECNKEELIQIHLPQIANDEKLKSVLLLIAQWQKRLGKLDEFDEIFLMKHPLLQLPVPA